MTPYHNMQKKNLGLRNHSHETMNLLRSQDGEMLLACQKSDTECKPGSAIYK